MRLIDASSLTAAIYVGSVLDQIKTLDDVLQLIEDEPAIDPERPWGEWKQCFEDWRHQIEGDKCSACGFEHYGATISHYHYCPNCGAKMKKDGDADD